MPPKRRQVRSSRAASTPSDTEGYPSDIDADSDTSWDETPKKRKYRTSSSRPVSTTKKRKTEEPSITSSRVPHRASMHVISDSVQPMRSVLLSWFSTVRDIRGMPWRKRYDPSLGPEERAQRAYEVWVSEIMLQQTQVATVIPYYNNWMNRFPTLPDLASASIDDVNALWKGLGYYSRASRLLAGAQKAVQAYNGKLPGSAQELEKNMPGIGRYSAGAISSIAYGERAPVLDGNVHRLLSRVLALYAAPKAKKTLEILWDAAEAFVQVDESGGQNSASRNETEYPGDINQALIELGSTVCTVRSPKCESCPLRRWCMAYQRSPDNNTEIIDIEDSCKACEPIPDDADITIYPMKPVRTKVREELDIVNVVEWQLNEASDHRSFLLIRRPEKGLLAGLYEFPTSENVSKTISKSSQEKLAITLLSSLFPSPIIVDAKGTNGGNDCPKLVKIVQAGQIVHIFSHLKKTFNVQWVVIEGGTTPPILITEDIKSNAKWATLHEVEEANTGTGTSKIWKAVKSLWI